MEQRAAAGSMARNEVGVGCALGTSEQNDAVIVKGLVHGGPCHLSCAVGGKAPAEKILDACSGFFAW